MVRQIIQHISKVSKNPFVSLFSYLFPLFLVLLPAEARTNSVGVIKSQENTRQWKEITQRLQSLGISYCILESSQWRQDSDLNNVAVLLLPNVENISGNQATILNRWMKQGGKIIVTGPTGTLSKPETRSQLRALFGAYWGYPNSSPSTIKLVSSTQSNWTNPKKLSSTLMGGVVIPTGVNSHTAAVWGAKGNPPAVVITEQSTYLGWRWGTDAIANISLDTAWLEASLNRHGVRLFPGSSPDSLTPPTSCQQNTSAPIVTKPNPTPSNSSRQASPQPQRIEVQTVIAPSQTPPEQIQRSPIDTPNGQSLPPTTPSEQIQRSPVDVPNGQLSAQQIEQMSQELASLIARFESTLIAAEANSHQTDLSTKKVIEESLQNRDSTKDTQSVTLASTTYVTDRRSYQIIKQAKQSLENFHQLVGQQNYTQAREIWLKARRELWDNYPTNRQVAQSEIRAMWLDRGTIVQAKSEADLAKVFDRMAESGINVVFFETLNASYPIYPSRIAPEQNPLTQGWDPLKAAVKLAHERGMEIHAWVWTFAAANQGHNVVMNQPKNYLGPVLSRHPDWMITNKHGGAFDYGRGFKKAFYDPANPEVQNYLLALFTEIVTNYDVDGIQLDYIRYPFQDPKTNETFGYGKSSRWLFKEMTGVDPIELSPRDPLWSQWTAFRVRQVDTFVATASARLKQLRPNLMVSVAVFPIERQQRLFRLQQNWEEWGKNNWIDLVFLMTYALDTGNLEDRTQALYERSSAGASLVIPGIRLLKIPDSVTVDQMQLIRNMPTSGFALFAAENLTPNLQSIFNRTQGAITNKSTKPLPHRQPFQSAAQRFQTLQQEWSFLLMNDRLVMDENTMRDWGQQVDATAAALNQLATNPTRQHLQLAQSSLNRFNRQFDNWMRQHQRVQPYQVQVWQNRLDTLERLLIYGDRLVFEQRINNSFNSSSR